MTFTIIYRGNVLLYKKFIFSFPPVALSSFPQQQYRKIQKKGLKYYEDVLKRIPRNEIVDYETKLLRAFNKVKNKFSGQILMGIKVREYKKSYVFDSLANTAEGSRWRESYEYLLGLLAAQMEVPRQQRRPPRRFEGWRKKTETETEKEEADSGDSSAA